MASSGAQPLVGFVTRAAIVSGLVALLVAGAEAQVCGDADDNGAVTVSDGVNVLRAAAGLDGPCRDNVVACDVDGNGAVSVTDGVRVLRAAAGLPETFTCATPVPQSTSTPTATRTPTPQPTVTPADVKRVFATSTFHTGSFGGLAGADAICAARAAAAGLSGTFMAWLSASDGAPATTFTMAAVPYALVTGTVVASDWADLVDGALMHAIDRDENGNLVGGDVWTGTDPSGSAVPATCTDWSTTSGTGQCGSSGAADTAWTAVLIPPCSFTLRLYCFEQ